MIFVTETELLDRLNHPNNSARSAPKVIHKTLHEGKGRPEGTKNVPLELKEKIGTLAKIEGPTVAAEVFDVSVSQASNYSKGSSTHGDLDPELKAGVEKQTQHIHEIARDKLLKTLDLIDEEKIGAEKPKTQASIARDLAAVLEKTTPSNHIEQQNIIHIIAPPIKEVNHFETIELPAVSKP